jgi:nuclear pore complex protein Nup98-Nup96
MRTSMSRLSRNLIIACGLSLAVSTGCQSTGGSSNWASNMFSWAKPKPPESLVNRTPNLPPAPSTTFSPTPPTSVASSQNSTSTTAQNSSGFGQSSGSQPSSAGQPVYGQPAGGFTGGSLAAQGSPAGGLSGTSPNEARPYGAMTGSTAASSGSSWNSPAGYSVPAGASGGASTADAYRTADSRAGALSTTGTAPATGYSTTPSYGSTPSYGASPSYGAPGSATGTTSYGGTPGYGTTPGATYGTPVGGYGSLPPTSPSTGQNAGLGGSSWDGGSRGTTGSVPSNTGGTSPVPSYGGSAYGGSPYGASSAPSTSTPEEKASATPTDNWTPSAGGYQPGSTGRSTGFTWETEGSSGAGNSGGSIYGN